MNSMKSSHLHRNNARDLGGRELVQRALAWATLAVMPFVIAALGYYTWPLAAYLGAFLAGAVISVVCVVILLWALGEIWPSS
jgi:hypothetical protein